MNSRGLHGKSGPIPLFFLFWPGICAMTLSTGLGLVLLVAAIGTVLWYYRPRD